MMRDDYNSPMGRFGSELDALLSTLLDGDFTAEQHHSLQEILRHDAEARRYYLRVMQVHAKLEWRSGRAVSQISTPPAISPQDDVVEEVTLADLADLMRREERAETIRLQSDFSQLQPPADRSAESREFRHAISVLSDPSFARYVAGQALRSKPARWFAAAAVLAMAVWLGITLISPGSPTPEVASEQTPTNQSHGNSPELQQDIVATLTDDRNAAWDRRPGKDLYPGQRFTLTQGFAEITTARGAVAILQAPAIFEFLNHDNAVYLRTGKLVGLCHTPTSKGFVVKTDHADITDLGTEFGVDTRNDALEASVFVGEIQLRLPTGHSQAITTNRTARVSYTDGLAHLVVEDEIGQPYTRRMPRPNLVTHASINLPRFEINVLPQAVYEDVKLFIDREHQLNGIDQKGLPDILLGGDLIQMPGSARADLDPSIGKRLELEIDVSMPADIYLLIERGTKLEPWVQQEYVKTGMLAGNDHESKSDGLRLGVGPGISIDRRFEIWQRRTPVAERTVIGGSMEGTMYAVIAVPFAQEAEARSKP